MTTESLSGTDESIRFRSQGSTDGDGALSDRGPANATNVEAPGERSAGNEDAIEEIPL